MNSDRYSPDDLTSDHDEAVAAEQQQPKSAREKPNPAKPNRAKKKDTDKVTGVTHRKKSPPKETSAHVRQTDSDKVADKATEKVTGNAGGKAKENAAKTTKIGSVKGGPMRAEAKRLIDAAGLTGKRIVKINVVGGHEAPTRAEGTAAQQNLEFVEAGHPNYAANGQLARDMFGVDDDTVTHVKITSMTPGTSSQAVRDGVSFYTPIPGVTAYNEITMAKVSEKEPYLIPVTDLVAQPTKKQLNAAILGFSTNMNMSDLDNSNTQVRFRYKPLDQYGVESSEHEVSFRFSVAPSNEPPVEPSGKSSGQEHVDDNITDNKPGTNEDERALDPANAERKSVTGTGNCIEQDFDDSMPAGLNGNFQTVSMDF